MFAKPKPPRIHLPKGWQEGVKSSGLHQLCGLDIVNLRIEAE